MGIMQKPKIHTIILTALIMNEAPLSSVDRNRLSQKLGITRNTTYLLQRQGKLPEPIDPPMGSKFWHLFEVDAIMLAMSDPEIQPEEMATSIMASRRKLPELILQAKSQQRLTNIPAAPGYKGGRA